VRTTVKDVLEKVQKYADALDKIRHLEHQLNMAKEEPPKKILDKPVKMLEFDLKEAKATAKRLGDERL
jgi:hypothetical protein